MSAHGFRRIGRVAGLGAGVLLALGVGLASRVTASELAPAVERAPRGGQCVADAAYMRRHHMEVLTHQRDETVHKGLRGGKASLQGCIACHASARTGSVARAPTDFCVACHAYAAVKIDCFDCHASAPAAVTGSAAQP
jgi:hypothetical protein